MRWTFCSGRTACGPHCAVNRPGRARGRGIGSGGPLPLAITALFRYNETDSVKKAGQRGLPRAGTDIFQESVIALKYDFASIEPKWQKKWQEPGSTRPPITVTSPSSMDWSSSPIPPVRDSMSVTPGPIPPWTWWLASAGWTAITSSSPMGYDASGLPTENYAIKNYIHPAKVDP